MFPLLKVVWPPIIHWVLLIHCKDVVQDILYHNYINNSVFVYGEKSEL